MKERRCSLECVFIETNVFAQDYGTLSESERERLYFDLMQGNGEPIADTGGLKRIRCGPGGHLGRSEKAWEVVFADYMYSDIRKRFFWLLFKCPVAVDKTVSEQEKEELRRLKARADRGMESYCERLQEEEPNGQS